MTRKATDKITCTNCKRERAESYFYMNTNPLFGGTRTVVCKDCISKFIGEKDSTGYLDRAIMVLAVLNKAFLPELWISKEKEWGKYITQLSSLPQYKELTFKDSDLSDGRKSELVSEKESKFVMTQDEIDESKDFWGSGFTNDELYWLNVEFTDFLNKYEVESKGMELLIQEICLTQLDIRKRRASGEKVDQQLKTLQDLLGSSNLKPVQETGANAVEQETFGTLIKKFENERPIPEPDEQWKDVDGIGKYLRVWFLGHLARMMGVDNPYKNEYDEEIKKYKIELDEEEDDENGIIR